MFGGGGTLLLGSFQWLSSVRPGEAPWSTILLNSYNPVGSLLWPPQHLCNAWLFTHLITYKVYLKYLKSIQKTDAVISAGTVSTDYSQSQFGDRTRHSSVIAELSQILTCRAPVTIKYFIRKAQLPSFKLVCCLNPPCYCIQGDGWPGSSWATQI